jgi:large subunit ribosomal protein L19
MIAKIEIKSRGTVRRAKLYYLRERVGKKARLKEMYVEGGIPASADIDHSDAARKDLGLDEVVEEALAVEESPVEVASGEVASSAEDQPSRNDGTSRSEDVKAAETPAEETPADEPKTETPAEETKEEEAADKS